MNILANIVVFGKRNVGNFCFAGFGKRFYYYFYYFVSWYRLQIGFHKKKWILVNMVRIHINSQLLKKNKKN
jgi:hypothetical protein